MNHRLSYGQTTKQRKHSPLYVILSQRSGSVAPAKDLFCCFTWFCYFNAERILRPPRLMQTGRLRMTLEGYLESIRSLLRLS